MFTWRSTKRPILALAPMEGYTDSAYRQIVKIVAPEAICFTEFSSADAIKYRAKKVLNKIGYSEIEKPLIVQIFGNDIDNFGEAAKIIEKTGVAGIDINMGCPASRVISSEHGSALMKCPQLAVDLVRIVKQNCKLPVSVKTRLGFEKADLDYFFSFCDDLVAAGVDLLTIHGRTTKQKFSGDADWNYIYKLKERYPMLTVIGCGDITSAEIAMAKIKNLDGVMVGRATFGNPWIMAEICAAMKGEKYSAPALLVEKIPLILKHCELAALNKGERVGMLEMRKHLAAYMRGFENASKYRQKLVRVESQKDAKEVLEEILCDAF